MPTELEDLSLEGIKEEPSHQIAFQPMQDGAKSPTAMAVLPTGYLDEEGKLHTEVEVREITGEEEDILSSRKISSHLKLNKILENCVTSIGPYDQSSIKWKSIIKSLTGSDRFFLILQVRMVSLGPLFSMKIKCSNEDCGSHATQTVDLNEFVIEGLEDPLKRTWEGTLPRSGKKYVAKVQTGWEETKLHNAKEQKDLMSLALLGRIVELDGNSNVTLSALKKLGTRDRQHLRLEFSKKEGKIDSSFEYECPSCGEERKEDIDIATPAFFFPSETLES